MSRPIDSLKTAEIISDRFNIPLHELVDVFAELPDYETQDRIWELKKQKDGKWRWTCPECGKYTKSLKDGLPAYCQFCGTKLK